MKTRKLKNSNQIVDERLAAYKNPEGHRPLLTRRDFLQAGIIQGAAAFALPSLSGLIGSDVLAAAGSTPISNPPAYLEINCAGGAAFLGSIAMLDSNRGILPSYNLCGQGSRSAAEQNMVKAFGNQVTMFKTGLFKGLMGVIGSQTNVLQNAALINLATSIGADSGSNPMSAFGLVQANIASGKYLPNLQTYSSFNLPAYVSPPSPIIVQGVDSISDVVRPRSDDAISQFGVGTQSSLMKYLKQMNDSQTSRWTSRVGGSILKSNVDAASQKVSDLIKDPTINFDPRKDAAFTQIWKSVWDGAVDPDLSLSESGPEVANRSLAESVIVYAMTRGYATTGGIFRTGYDYHGGSRVITDAKDAEIGKLIGRVLLSFQAVNKPVFIYITTDGTCFAPSSEQGGNQWVGDSNINTVNMVIAYRPGVGVSVTTTAGKPETQVGSFTSGQVSDALHAVASPRGSAAAAFVNYLNFAGVDAVNSPALTVTTLLPEQLKTLVALQVA
jgi:hypothetical protein